MTRCIGWLEVEENEVVILEKLDGFLSLRHLIGIVLSSSPLWCVNVEAHGPGYSFNQCNGYNSCSFDLPLLRELHRYVRISASTADKEVVGNWLTFFPPPLVYGVLLQYLLGLFDELLQYLGHLLTVLILIAELEGRLPCFMRIVIPNLIPPGHSL
ncbi:155aa long hypothetical protein [Pyrococcus horikoshii OT3]|uniref:Uncharacterized protein n=1 Tax=Pyrococcus horikoshii (strain ATCC 700860 / DSM 12428 / JCM 9974 / NBRC 100139 / OT-3) TaxID=70601 RepID=O57743_PYRHO|nr:155aa long hypothetical protein [Pyrococcus horikoshii OT3]